MPSVVPVTTRRTVLSPTAAMLIVVSPCLAAGLVPRGGRAQKTGGSPRCERGSAASTIAKTSQSGIAIKEEYVLTAFESIIGRRRDGDGRRGAIVLAASLAVFFAALVLSSASAYGAPEANPPPEKAATKKPTKAKPKVKASIRRGRLNVLGTAKSDKITLRLKPGNKSRLQVDVGGNGSAEFTFKRSAFNRIVVHGASGADTLSINERYGVFTGNEATSLFGDTGNDVLRGGSAAERLFGGIGNDTIDGKRGNDLIEGGAGSDLVVFNGSKAAEKFAFSANGKRLRFVGAGTMNIASVERFDLRASGGADNVVVNDLTGAGLAQLNADLANDGAADVVDIKGSSAANELRVRGGISISGIGAAVNVLRAQAANDKLNLDPGAGSDRVVGRGHGRKRHDRRGSIGGRRPHLHLWRSGRHSDRRRQLGSAGHRVPRRQRHAQRRSRARRRSPS